MDVQDIQQLKEIVQRSKTFLQHNISVTNSIRSLNSRLRSRQNELGQLEFENLDIIFEEISAELHMHLRNFEALLDRISSRAALVRFQSHHVYREVSSNLKVI